VNIVAKIKKQTKWVIKRVDGKYQISMIAGNLLLVRRWVSCDEAMALYHLLSLAASCEFYMGVVGDFSDIGSDWKLISWVDVSASPHVPARLPANGGEVYA
jgi:hypothetical protein